MKQEVRMSVDEVMISFKYLCLQCLKKTPLILGVMVICSILFLTIGYVKDYREYKIVNDKQADKTVELTYDDNIAIENYLLLKERVAYLEEYNENSLLMALDFTNVCDIRIQCTIVADENLKGDIAQLFINYIKTEMVAQMSKMEGFPEADYLREIIRIERQGNTEESKNGVFTICIWTEEEEQGIAFADASMELLESYSLKLKDEVGDFTFAALKGEGEFRWINTVYTAKKEAYKEIQAIKTEFSECKSQLTSNQINAINTMEQGETESSEVDKDIVISKPSLRIKYLVVGAFLGIVLAIMAVIVREIFGGKVQTHKELHERLGLSHLVNLKLKSNSAVGNIIDKIFFTKEIGRLDSKIDFLTVQLKHYMKEEKNKLCILSSVGDKETEILTMIENKIQDKGINCELVNVAVDGSCAINQMIENGNILLVEFVGESFIKNIYEEYEHCCQIDANIIGYISIEK